MWLELKGNEWSGCIPEGLRDIDGGDLGQLGMPYCGEASGPIPAELGNLTGLEFLYRSRARSRPRCARGAVRGDGRPELDEQTMTNWLSDQPLREWYGVATDGGGRVAGLHLVGNQLSGPIPGELGDSCQPAIAGPQPQ